MKEIPILFSGPMVRAILDGRKTQTRRIVKLPDDAHDVKYWAPPSGRSQTGYADPGVNYWTDAGNHIDPCPYGQPGDRLWVREAFANIAISGYPEVWIFRADSDELPPYDARAADNKWRPSIHMPKAACRLWLEVKAVRVERLQDISTEDIKAEGVTSRVGVDGATHRRGDYLHNFSVLWDSLSAKRGHGWATNPWVWVIEFERLDDKAVRKG